MIIRNHTTSKTATRSPFNSRGCSLSSWCKVVQGGVNRPFCAKKRAKTCKMQLLTHAPATCYALPVVHIEQHVAGGQWLIPCSWRDGFMCVEELFHVCG